MSVNTNDTKPVHDDGQRLPESVQPEPSIVPQPNYSHGRCTTET